MSTSRGGDDKLAELHDQIADGVAALVDSEAWRAMLDAAARFHNYSLGNLLLIAPGTLRDLDALLLLTHHDHASPGASPAGNGLVTTTLYIGTDLDDADVWARAVKLRAAEVLFVPDDDEKLTSRLAQHLGAVA